MTGVNEQHRLVATALEPLKALNSALVAIRLYSAISLRVENSVEKGFKAIQQFLDETGEFEIALIEQQPAVCGAPIPDETLQNLTDLIVFRQLELLEVNRLVFRPEIDLKTFKQLLTVLTARPQKLKREGGGPAYIHRLGLANFLTKTTGAAPDQTDDTKAQPSAPSEQPDRTDQPPEAAAQPADLAAAISALLQDDVASLDNKELIMQLPAMINQLTAEDNSGVVGALLDIIVQQASTDDAPNREQLVGALVLIGDNLVRSNHWQWLAHISGFLLSWMQQTSNGDYVFEKICNLLQQLMLHNWREQRHELADQILEMLYRIRVGLEEKPQPMRALVGRVQDKGTDQALLGKMLAAWLAAPTEEMARRRLILQGPIAHRYLLETLLRSENAQERLKLMDLLGSCGHLLPPILLERLETDLPWYGSRNLIHLLAETGSKPHLTKVLPYLQHEDLRVQRETIICLYKLGGTQKKEYLLTALAHAHDQLKPQIVKALAPFCDQEVIAQLAQLIDRCEQIAPAARDLLLVEICRTLARSPMPESATQLHRLLTVLDSPAGRDITKEVRDAARQAYTQFRSKRQGQTASSAASPPITGLDQEQTIRDLLARKETDKAKKLLVELIGQTAHSRQFAQAEQLRQWLIEIDDMALTEIVRTAELIAEAKHTAIDQGHIEVWRDLYEALTTDEFSTMYHGLKHQQLANETVIVNQGDIQTQLFFINSGRVKLFYRKESQELLVKTIGPGEVFGASSFFNPSVWTISAACLGQTEISSLKREQLHHWQDDYPGLEAKLSDFCLRFEKISGFFKDDSNDRRLHRRFKMTGKVEATLLDNNGQSVGATVNGTLRDISPGGAAFITRIAKKENAQLLLGRRTLIMPTAPQESQPTKRSGYEGIILAVRGYDRVAGEYSVHIRFDRRIDRADLPHAPQDHNALRN